jgi:DNA-binding beta-propeller fold protein YncE
VFCQIFSIFLMTFIRGRIKMNNHFFPLKSLLLISALLIGFYIYAENSVPSGRSKIPGISNISTQGLQYLGQEQIASSQWIKSVIFNSTGSRLYTLNLENMAIDEFDRQSRIPLRKFSFLPKPATGWDYKNNIPIESFEEKPVEACFSHHDKLLWVSLHNAGGIVGIRLDSSALSTKNASYLTKGIVISDATKEHMDTLYAPFIKTGKTPKVIVKTSSSNFLMVSNWHSGTLSILSANDSLAPYATKLRDIKVGAFPRGIYINPLSGRAYISIMGGSSIRVLDRDKWKLQKTIPVIQNPRHITADSTGKLFVSFNSLSHIACIDPVSGRTLFEAKTGANPRTIILSKSQKYLFVTCYGSDNVQVFKVNKNSFDLLYSINCSGKPIGIDLYEDSEVIEAWVCTYKEGTLKILTFRKS